MRIVLFFITMCACYPAAFAQQADTLFRHIRTIRGDISSFTVDNLDNVYILNSRNQLRKIDINGDSVATFNDIRKFGKATLVDVSNPLKVLLYYHDFSTVVMLDRFLNIRNTIDLRKQQIFQARVIAQSYDNNVWVFDDIDSKLKKLNEEGKLLLETPDFRLLTGQQVTPVRLFDENQFVYLCDTTRGVYVFDYYGSLKNNIMIQGWSNLKVTGNYIYGSRGDTLYRYEINNFRYDEWLLPPQLRGAVRFNFSAARLYALKNEVIEVYEIR